jgi:hypothetical protein
MSVKFLTSGSNNQGPLADIPQHTVTKYSFAIFKIVVSSSAIGISESTY